MIHLMDAPTSWTFLRPGDFATTFTSGGRVPTRTSQPDEIALWHLARRTILVDTESGIVCDPSGHRIERPDDRAYGKIYLGYVGGKARWASAHRVVWLAKHGPIPGNYRIVHRNGIRWDNRISNLNIATHHEAMLAARGHLDLDVPETGKPRLIHGGMINRATSRAKHRNIA